MSLKTDEEILESVHMARNVAVEGREEFEAHEEHADEHGVSHDRREFVNGFLTRIELAVLLDQVGKQYEQGGTGAESGGKESGGHDGGQPVVPRGKAGVQEGRDGMDRDRPGNGDVDERFYPFGIMSALTLRFENVPSDEDVQQQVAVEYYHVPEEYGVGRRI